MDQLFLTRRGALKATLAGLLASPLIGAAHAQSALSLRIGVAAPATTLDPHLQNNGPNNALNTHIYDALTINDEKSQSRPGLASSWKTLDPTHWEFTLRDGVTFTDGAPFGFADVKASIERANTLPSNSSFRTYTRSIKSITPGSAPNKVIIETA